MLGIYVDDCLCIGDKKVIEKTKIDLRGHFEIKDEGLMQE